LVTASLKQISTALPWFYPDFTPLGIAKFWYHFT